MPSVLIIPEGVESSDGRSYEPGSLTWRDRIPHMFLDATSERHEGAQFTGTVTNIRRQTVDGVTWIVGDLGFDSDEAAREAERLSTPDMMPGVSADVAQIWEETDEVDEMGFPVFRLAAAEIVGVTQVPMPAFGGARILTAEESQALVPEVVTAALLPSVGSDWFSDPGLAVPTPLTVTPEGRVYGHLATWGTCHIGFDDTCVSPPLSETDYAYFHTGAVRVGDEEIPVGHITMGTGHASLSADPNATVAHYDNTGTCAADVCIGEDEHGIWVAGAVRPDVDIDALRAASLSGDWRRINGNLELVAALAVNVPGFPIPRTQTAVAASGQLALVASAVLPNAPKSEIQVMAEAVERLTDRLDQVLTVLLADGSPEEIEEAAERHPSGHLAQVLDLSSKVNV